MLVRLAAIALARPAQQPAPKIGQKIGQILPKGA